MTLRQLADVMAEGLGGIVPEFDDMDAWLDGLHGEPAPSFAMYGKWRNAWGNWRKRAIRKRLAWERQAKRQAARETAKQQALKTQRRHAREVAAPVPPPAERSIPFIHRHYDAQYWTRWYQQYEARAAERLLAQP